jgi:hypothetical protein
MGHPSVIMIDSHAALANSAPARRIVYMGLLLGIEVPEARRAIGDSALCRARKPRRVMASGPRH